MKKIIPSLLIALISACNTGSSTKTNKAPQDIVKVRWEFQISGTTASLRGVCTVSPSIAWASGSNGTYLRTTNGGKTWEAGTVPGAFSLDFRDVEAENADTACLLSAGNPAKIYRTYDGGLNWIEQYSNTAEGVFFDAMAFWDPDNGIAFSDPVDSSFLIITTSDGGITWNKIPPGNIPPPLPGEGGFAASGTCITVQGKNNAWIGTGGPGARVFMSKDKGQSWMVTATPIISGEPSTGIFSVTFLDSLNGVAVGGDYKNPGETKHNAAITNNGGKTWNLVEQFPPGGYRSCVALVPDESGLTLITVGPNGTDYSIDKGKTWTPVDTVGYHSISFAKSAPIGWAVGANGRISKLIFEK